MTSTDDSNSGSNEKKLNTTARLPCRGCTVSCKNYTLCDGKPWRMNKVPTQYKKALN